MNKSRLPWMLVLLGLGMAAKAVQLNPNGEGEVLIYPFYSVNNSLNTAYTVVNSSDRAKALKVTFREAHVGLVVLSFNVYLGPYDVWTGVLGATESTQPGHQGEPSVVHVSGDASCASGIDKTGSEFSASQLNDDLSFNNRSLERATTGFFEVLELGELSGVSEDFVSHDEAGTATNCAAIEAAWADGQWDLDDLDPPTGGLAGTAFFVNVAEGISLSYDALALQNFWASEGAHTAPGSLLPNLSSGNNVSHQLLDDGRLAESTWSTGHEAVSAVLMQSLLINEYALDTGVNGKSEWVLTFPTKHLHVNTAGQGVMPPFVSAWNGSTSCDEFSLMIYDRESQWEVTTVGGVMRPPAPPPPSLCYSANVMSLILPWDFVRQRSQILGHSHHITLVSPELARATENGWAHVEFHESRSMLPEAGIGFEGLPVTGFLAQQYTNAGAAQGLLAQYGSIYPHKSRVTAVGGDEELN